MVSLRGARGSLEWKGKRLKYVANESARAQPAWRPEGKKAPQAPWERLVGWQPGRLACRGHPGAAGHSPFLLIIEPWTKPAGPPCPSSAH